MVLIVVLVLLSIWFQATARPSLFKHCNVSTSEIAALRDLYINTEGYQWEWYRIDGVKWSFDESNINPCYPPWQGIVCDRLNVTSGFNCSIVSLILYTCNLRGSIPDSIGNLYNLVELSLFNNYLNGTLPSTIGNLTRLEVISINNNLLSGTIPVSMPASLRSIDMGENHFTGQIPSDLLISTHLQYLLLYENQLTGSFTDMDLPRVVQIDLSDNMLDGSLSSAVCYKRLQYLAVSNNLLTGTLPGCVYAQLFYVDLSYNNLVGNIAHSLSYSIEYLILNNNHFTSTIPVLLQKSKAIQLIVNNNHFTGPVPVPGADLTFLYMQNNILSGSIMASNWTNTSLSYVNLCNNEITGTLPPQIFSSSSQLVSFAVSSNCITGSIPTDICSLQNLLYLGLDGLSTAKSCRVPIFPAIPELRSFTLQAGITKGIPKCLFSMNVLQTLHLSGNSLIWSFPSDVEISSSLMSMSLSHNKLTGTIPDSIQLRPWKDLDLSYNRLGGTISAKVDLFDNSSLVLQVNRLSGKIPHSILNLESINILTGNLFFCNLARDSLPVNDVAYRIYECGSNSFNQASIVWCCLAAVAVVIVVLIFRKRCLQLLLDLVGVLRQYLQELENVQPNEHLYMFRRRTLLTMRYIIVITLIAVVVFLPLYAILTEYYKTSEHQYAWTVSAAFLTGAAPAILLFFIYFGFIVLLFRVWLYLKEPRSSKVEKRTSIVRKKLTWRQFAILCALVLMNCAFMSLVNGAYVLVILNSSTQVSLAAQIMIALFKLLWNDFGVRRLIQFSRRFYSTIHRKDLDGDYGRLEMPYMTFIVLFNCIIAPCLATAAVDSDCFYNVFAAASAVVSEFPIVTEVSTCYELGKANHTVFVCTNATQSVSYLDVSYDPPFIYSYQCSSSILTNYASVYVYMFLMIAFLKPVSLVLVTKCYNSISPGTYLYYWIDQTIYNLMKPPTEHRLQKSVLFHSERIVLRTIGKIAVFLTFGIVFPPLAVVVCVAFITETYLNLAIIGRFLVRIKDTKMHDQFRAKLNHDSQDSMNLLMVPLVRLVVPFAACFYAFFVFDIYGDQVGLKRSIWAPVLLVASPLLIWFVYSLYLLYIERKQEKSELMEADEEARQTEMVVRVTENVLQAKTDPPPPTDGAA